MRISARWLAHPARYVRVLRAVTRISRWLRPVLRQGRLRRLPWPLSGWTASRDLPLPPGRSFRDWWVNR